MASFPPTKVKPGFTGLRRERFEPLPGTEPTPFAVLGPRRCKWPIGDVLAAGLTCCGAPAAGPYCQPHQRLLHDRPATRAMDKWIAKKPRPRSHP